MENVKCIAVDWSGAKKEGRQLEHIWVAIVQSDSIIRLKNGFTRNEVMTLLEKEIELGGPLIIGFDFAFSFPKWYLKRRKLGSVADLWHLAESEADRWIDCRPYPFWGGKGYPKPEKLKANRELEFRQTEKEHRRNNPKSVFNVNGAGTVGPGSIRGMPSLARLKDKVAIWPFDKLEPEKPCVIEIYPRLFYGKAVTNQSTVSGRDSRKSFLANRYPELERHWRDIMVGSGDAFDAGVSALEISTHAGEIPTLSRPTQPLKLWEGEIWFPRQHRQTTG